VPRASEHVSIKKAHVLKQMEEKYRYRHPLFIFAGEVNSNCLIIGDKGKFTMHGQAKGS